MHVTEPTTDAADIRASRTDPTAFGPVFDRHWPRIHRYCVERAGPPGEDLAAETFRVAFAQRSRYDGRDDAAPWLYGIATNLLRGWFRSSAAERSGPELAAVLAELADADRDALLLHAFADLTYEQIACATSVPAGTVASRINRARGRVRAHLETLELCR